MPPKVLRRNVVEDVLSKIPATERPDDIPGLTDKVHEQLRLLNLVVSVRRLGKHDSQESRAAVLLEYAIRAAAPGRNRLLSMATLASAVGMKKATLEVLHKMIGNYLPPNAFSSEVAPSTTKFVSATAKKTAPSLQSSGNRPQVRRTLRSDKQSAIEGTSSTIPEISIRLGSQVYDSHGFAKRAQKLFDDMTRFIQNTTTAMPAYEKREYLYDMDRKRSVYEAVCFYVIALQGRPAKKARLNVTNTTENYGRDGELQLGEQDVIDASNVTSLEFREVLPTVLKFSKLLSEHDQAERKAVVQSKRKRSGKQQTTASGESQTSESTNNAGEIVDKMAQLTEDYAHPKVNPTFQEQAPKFVYSEEFLEWKRNVLSAACFESRTLLHLDFDRSMDDISPAEALSHAADGVERRLGA